MTEPWHRIKDFSERELVDMDTEVLLAIANRIGCKSDELEVISDADDPDMYFFGEVDFETSREVFWKYEANLPSASIYLSELPLKDGGFYVEERVRDSGGTVSNYWRKPSSEEAKRRDEL